MKLFRTLAIATFLIALLTPPLTADLIWTGAGDSVSLFQEANWLDDNGVVPSAGTINPNVVITAATGGLVRIDSGAGSPSNYSNGFLIGANDLFVGGGKTLGSSGGVLTAGGARFLTIDGGSLRTGTVSGFNNFSIGNGSTIDLIGSAGINGASGTSISIFGGSTVSTQFITNSTVTVDGGSAIEMLGGANPVNNTTLDFLDAGSSLHLENETFADFNAEHSSKVTFQGNSLVFGLDAFVVEAGDNAIASNFGASGVSINFFAAVPEPNSLTMVGALVLIPMFRRRKR